MVLANVIDNASLTMFFTSFLLPKVVQCQSYIRPRPRWVIGAAENRKKNTALAKYIMRKQIGLHLYLYQE